MVALCEFSPLYLLQIIICLYVSEALQRGLQRQFIQIIVISTRQLSLLLKFPGDQRGRFEWESQATVFQPSCTGATVAFLKFVFQKHLQKRKAILRIAWLFLLRMQSGQTTAAFLLSHGLLCTEETWTLLGACGYHVQGFSWLDLWYQNLAEHPC